VSASGFVYPSRWEACSNSVLESTSLGVPTLTTDNPLGQWLARRGGAYAVPTGVEAIAGGLRKLASGSEAALVGKRGAEAVRDELSWDAVARIWLPQVEELV
jgi:glycosyltransferase involved in cell wall biosynthesis